MEIARFSNYLGVSSDPENVKGASKGKNSIYVLAVSRGEPKQQESVGGKVTRAVIENYLRRPSMKEEAMQKMTEFAHDAVTHQQSASYQAECDVGILMTKGDAFRWLCAGGVRAYHFVNGQIMHSGGGKTMPLGRSGEKERPDLIPETKFEKGENSFLLCSDSVARYIRESELENTLSVSDTAEEWLQALRDLYEDRCQGEPCALMTVFMPPKKKRMPKKLVIILIVALILAAAAFFGLGAMRRKNGGPGPNGPQQPPMEQGAPGMEPTEPPAPQGGAGQQGERPTHPPKPTEPPAPSGGQGQPGEKPTEPPAPSEGQGQPGEKPTEPPAPGTTETAEESAEEKTV